MPLGPSLSVNQMWTTRNEHAPKVNVRFLTYIYMPKKGIFEEKKGQVCCLPLSSSPLHLLSSKKNSLKINMTSFL